MTTRRFAEGTTVAAEKSKLEIEQVLSRYGASSFASGWQGDVAVIAFEAHGRRVKFVLPMPNRKDARFTKDPRASWREVSELQQKERYDAEVRRLWRALLLAIKAKLEVVESGIATFEQEFLAHIVLPHGPTVGDWAAPELEKIYRTGGMPPLLTSGGPR
jgi:hypothetical protein